MAESSKQHLSRLLYESDSLNFILYQIERDPYGRLLGFLVNDASQCINIQMLEEGYAYFYPHEALNPIARSKLSGFA